LLDRTAIAALIPHQGRMCLLDAALAWDTTSILCRSIAHRDPTNPLRRGGRLAVVCTVELGLQAMALHGALAAGGPQPAGMVTSLRGVTLARPFADDLPDPLTIEARLLAGEPRGYAYHFAVTAADRPVCAGEATIFLPPRASA
jgi:predicted hotdog family 3-hydroxylacyl-ACP dehydratase